MVGDKVRHLINLSIFDKKGLSKWSNEVFTIIDKKPHSYKLDNNKSNSVLFLCMSCCFNKD